MRAITLENNTAVLVNNEEHKLYERMLISPVALKELDSRDKEVSKQLFMKGLLKKVKNENTIYFKAVK